MKKIKISGISQKAPFQKGFGKSGCHNSGCPDSCCRYGADFDKAAYDLVLKHRRLVEERSGKKIETCFEDEWSGETDFLGGDSVRSTVADDGYCCFHSPSGKGCVLYQLVFEKALPKRLVPSVCRLYPLTWADGVLTVYDEDGEDNIEPDCACVDPKYPAQSNILATQFSEILDIFEICPSKTKTFDLPR